MPLNEEQLAFRVGRVTASIAPAILGADPYRTPGDALLEIKGELHPERENEAMAMGNLFEPALVQWAANQLGIPVARTNATAVHPLHEAIMATLDAVLEDGTIVEAKTVGLNGPAFADDWGEPGTDQVPDKVLVQCYVQLACYEPAQRVVVPVVIGQRGHFLYFIERDDVEIDALVDRLRDWHHDHILHGIPLPAEQAPQLPTLMRRKREPGKVWEASEDIAARYIAAIDALRAAEASAEAAKAELLHAAGDASDITCGGAPLAKVISFERTTLDSDELKRRQPDVWREYARTRETRQLRAARGKNAWRPGNG